MTTNQTSFWSARVRLPSGNSTRATSSGFWDNPNGNPASQDGEYTSPWRRRTPSVHIIRQSSEVKQNISGTLTYNAPIQYIVKKTGYYCVGKSQLSFNFRTLIYRTLQPSYQSLFFPHLSQPASQRKCLITLHTVAKYFFKIPSMVNCPPQITPKSMYVRCFLV